MSSAEIQVWADVIWKVGSVIGFLGIYFLKTSFVPKKQYYEDRDRSSVERGEINRKLDLMLQQDATLKDHEQRIRSLERAQ